MGTAVIAMVMLVVGALSAMALAIAMNVRGEWLGWVCAACAIVVAIVAVLVPHLH